MIRLFALAALVLLAVLPTAVHAQSVVVEPQFQSVGHFHNGTAPAQMNDRWGFINTRGEWILRPRYEGVLRGKNGRFGIRENGLWGYIDVSGEVVIPPAYDDAEPFSEGVAAVKRAGRWGYINTTGAIETPFEFSEVGRREGRLFPARGDDGVWRTMRAAAGVKALVYNQSIDDDGAIFRIYDRSIAGFVYANRVYGFSEATTVAVFDGGEVSARTDGYISTLDGLKLFKSIRRRSEGWTAATLDGRSWGYILDDGRFWDPQVFTGAREFSEGVAPVEHQGKWGYITKEGKFALTPRYDRAYSFYEGYATMRVGEKRGFLKLNDGRITEFVSPRYEDVFRFQEGLAPIKVGGLWGFLSSDDSQPAMRAREIVDLIPE